MAAFRVGQRVRVRYANTPKGRLIVGHECVVTEVCDLWLWDKTFYGLDRAPIYWGEDGAYAWWSDQLEPIQPEGMKPASWSDCLWQPEHMRATS